jgi:hypothetical protein
MKGEERIMPLVLPASFSYTHSAPLGMIWLSQSGTKSSCQGFLTASSGLPYRLARPSQFLRDNFPQNLQFMQEHSMAIKCL